MKTKFTFGLGMVLIISFVIALNSYNDNSLSTDLLLKNVEALSYGEGPGGVDNRHNQAVNCPTAWNPWNIVPGCCWGYEQCNFSICPNQSGC